VNGHITVLGKYDCSAFRSLPSSAATAIVPAQWINFTRLTAIHFAFCNRSGTIPRSIGSLTNLEILELYSNRIAGTVPDELGLLTRLTYLHLGANPALSGSIPPSLTALTALTSIDFDGDSLTGTLPHFNFSQFTSCCALGQGNNLFTCPLPSGASTCRAGESCSYRHSPPVCACTGSSVSLPPDQCNAWIDFHTAAGGDWWSSGFTGQPFCRDSRTDPCACMGNIVNGNHPVCNPDNTTVLKM
jgi:hypothetical protein